MNIHIFRPANPLNKMKSFLSSWTFMKSMQIYEMRRKSTDDEKSAWIRAKVSIWGSKLSLTVSKHPCPKQKKTYGNHEKQSKFMQICEKQADRQQPARQPVSQPTNQTAGQFIITSENRMLERSTAKAVGCK